MNLHWHEYLNFNSQGPIQTELNDIIGCLKTSSNEVLASELKRHELLKKKAWL